MNEIVELEAKYKALGDNMLKANDECYEMRRGFEATIEQMRADLNQTMTVNEGFETENKRLKEEIIQLKTQALGGSENDRCAIEEMDEAQALKGE